MYEPLMWWSVFDVFPRAAQVIHSKFRRSRSMLLHVLFFGSGQLPEIIDTRVLSLDSPCFNEVRNGDHREQADNGTYHQPTTNSQPLC